MELACHLLHTRWRDNLYPDVGHAELDFYLLVIQVAFAQLLSVTLPRRRIVGNTFILGPNRKPDLARRRQKDVQDPIFRRVFGTLMDFPHLSDTRHLDCHVYKITYDRIYLAANVANLGKLCRLYFDKRGVCKPCKATGNLGFAHPGRPDH